jgi:SecDF, P1 head subdomain
MRWICLLAGLLFLTFLPAHAGHTPPKIFLRIHVQTSGSGQSAMEVTTIKIPPSGQEIMIRTLPEVSEKNLVGIAQDETGLHLTFDHVGKVNLDAVTAQNQGRILVVLIDGFVIYAPIIDEQISNGQLDIPRQVTPQVLALLQDLVQQNIRQANKT